MCRVLKRVIFNFKELEKKLRATKRFKIFYICYTYQRDRYY